MINSRQTQQLISTDYDDDDDDDTVLCVTSGHVTHCQWRIKGGAGVGHGAPLALPAVQNPSPCGEKISKCR